MPIHRFHLVLLLLSVSTWHLRAAAPSLDARLALLYPDEQSERRYVKERLENLFGQLRYRDRADRGRQTEKIRARLRRDLLLRYDADARLADAFRTGRYNEATAALLLALSLERFELPYAAHVDHYDAYLSSPSGGMLPHPTARRRRPAKQRAYRREYLNLLRLTTEYIPVGTEEDAADSLFYRYYYTPGEELNFRQLSAYAHLREAQLAYRAHRYRRALKLLDDALRLEARPAFTVLRRAALQQLSALAAVERLSALQQYDRQLQGLLDRDDTAAARRLPFAYLDYAPAGYHEGWREQLNKLYELRLLDHLYNRASPAEAIAQVEAMLVREPDNPRYRHYLTELLLGGLRRDVPERDAQLAAARRATDRHPFLEQTDRYADIELRHAALGVRDHFARGEVTQGQRALEGFRRKLEVFPGGHDRPLWTLTAFIAASNHYFAANEYARARAYVAEALRYDPEKAYLLHRRELLARY